MGGDDEHTLELFPRGAGETVIYAAFCRFNCDFSICP